MKLKIVFKHVKNSEASREYAITKLEKLDKFKLKPISTEFVIGMQGRENLAELRIQCKDHLYVAKGYGHNMFQAIDQSVLKIAKQLKKTKGRVQNHKQKEHTGVHTLECLNDKLEMDYSKLTGVQRKSAA
ncbi:MAG: ribosome-associated translation inhibitor RaiA [Bdellovibrionales bacterium]